MGLTPNEMLIMFTFYPSKSFLMENTSFRHFFLEEKNKVEAP